MLLLMISFVMNNFAPNWIFKPMNENANMGVVKPSVCRTIIDTSATTLNPSTWIKNDKYSCGDK